MDFSRQKSAFFARKVFWCTPCNWGAWAHFRRTHYSWTLSKRSSARSRRAMAVAPMFYSCFPVVLMCLYCGFLRIWHIVAAFCKMMLCAQTSGIWNIWSLKACALFVFCWSEKQMNDEHAVFKCTFDCEFSWKANFYSCHFDISFPDEASDSDVPRLGANLVGELFKYCVLCCPRPWSLLHFLCVCHED